MDYSGVLDWSMLHLLAVRMWLDNVVTFILPYLDDMAIFIRPALRVLEEDIEMHIFLIRRCVYYGAFLLFPIIYTGISICHHCKHWKKPNEQKWILVQVTIPSVINIVSWVALHVNEDSKTIFLILDSIKECSAGLVIPMFMRLLQTYMNINSSKLSPDTFRQKIGARLISNFFPVTLVQPRFVALDQDNLQQLDFWTWQYVVIRLVCTVFMIVFQLFGMYPLWLSWVFFIIMNLSVFVAYYTAYAFYLAFYEDFPRLWTYAKFFHIKCVVFFCFWQGGVLKVLGTMGIIKYNHFWRQELHNSLLVLETLLLSVTQYLAYTHRAYVDYKFIPRRRSIWFIHKSN